MQLEHRAAPILALLALAAFILATQPARAQQTLYVANADNSTIAAFSSTGIRHASPATSIVPIVFPMVAQ